MKILHLNLGLPPYRTGGMTSYSFDLMQQQRNDGHLISLLYPGHYTVTGRSKIVSNKHPEISVFELINPNPVPIPFGVRKPKSFIRSKPQLLFDTFLTTLEPDVIHVHTLMGIPIEFFKSANNLAIPIVFTTHDYYGLCPQTNFMFEQNSICNGNDPVKCATCNMFGSASNFLIAIMQSPIYRVLKGHLLFTKLRWLYKSRVQEFSLKGEREKNINQNRVKEFKELQDYYVSIFKCINFFHFNSTTSEHVYQQKINCRGEVIPITLSSINDNRLANTKKTNGTFSIIFIGSRQPYKGFRLLINAFRILLERGFKNVRMHLFGDDFSEYEKMFPGFVKSGGVFSRNDVKEVFSKADLLIVPSIWMETFGLVVLESLSYGVPVIVSENVGAKDLLQHAPARVTFEPESESLAILLEEFIREEKKLDQYKKWIRAQPEILTMEKHGTEIMNLYQQIIN